MKRLEIYAKRIVEGHGLPVKEEEDMFAEMLDHLKQLKAQYMNKGYGEEDAEKCAIYDFGEEDELRNKWRFTINPFHRLFQGLLWVVAAIYIIVVFRILFIGTISRLMYGEFKNNGATYRFSEKYGGSLNMIPFKSILEFLIHHNQYNLDIIINNLIGNMLLFVPFGFLLPLLVKKTFTLSRVLFLSVLVGASLEAIQKVTRLGVADIDDVLLYTIGSMIGFGFFRLLNWGWKAWRTKQYEWKRIG